MKPMGEMGMRSIFGLVVTGLFLSAAAQADWSGRWCGEGTLDLGTQTVRCPKVQLNIKEEMGNELDNLWFVAGIPDCGLNMDFGGEFEALVFNGKLYVDGEEVGTVTDERIHFLKYRRDLVKEYIEIDRLPDGRLSHRYLISSPIDHAQFEVSATLEFVPEGAPLAKCF